MTTTAIRADTLGGAPNVHAPYSSKPDPRRR
jgi:hypothetical protein